MSILKDKILACSDLPTQPVNVVEWGVEVYIKHWSGQDRANLLALHEESKKKPYLLGEFNARVVAMSLVDDKGERVFTDKDIAAIQQKNGAVLDKLAKEALRVNGIGPDAVEQAEKN